MQRIGLLGGESTGKSSLAKALAMTLPACIVDEKLRRFVDREGRPPRQDEQGALLRAQREAEDSVAAACQHGIVVADPAVLMTAVYSELYFRDRSLMQEAIDHAAASYDLLVWCGTDVRWTPDGRQRDGEGHRKAADIIIARLVHDELEPRGLHVIHVTGSVEQRAQAVVQAWQTVRGAGPT